MDRIDDLFTLVGELRGDMNRQFADVRGEIASLRHDANRDFRWLAGFQMTTMLTVIGVLVTALFRQGL